MDQVNLNVVFGVFGIVGTFASLIALVVALVQSLRYKAARENYQKLRQIRNTQIWGSITLTLEAYDTLDEAKALIKNKPIDSEIAMKIVSARKSIVAQYLRLLEEAILDEDMFTEATATEWRSMGLLENEWRYQAALKLTQGKSKIQCEKVKPLEQNTKSLASKE